MHYVFREHESFLGELPLCTDMKGETKQPHEPL